MVFGYRSNIRIYLLGAIREVCYRDGGSNIPRLLRVQIARVWRCIGVLRCLVSGVWDGCRPRPVILFASQGDRNRGYAMSIFVATSGECSLQAAAVERVVVYYRHFESSRVPSDASDGRSVACAPYFCSPERVPTTRLSRERCKAERFAMRYICAPA